MNEVADILGRLPAMLKKSQEQTRAVIVQGLRETFRLPPEWIDDEVITWMMATFPSHDEDY